MDNIYKGLISFSRIKETLQERRKTVAWLGGQLGLLPARVSQIISGAQTPKTDLVARIAGTLKVHVSDICSFSGIEAADYFKDRELMYSPPSDAGTELTYRPLRRFLEVYLKEHGGKTADDLFDRIEPYRRRMGYRHGLTREAVVKSLAARGLELSGYSETHPRRKYDKGLPYATRTKLRQDRPLNIRTIYDICKFLGCSVDFVMSYK